MASITVAHDHGPTIPPLSSSSLPLEATTATRPAAAATATLADIDLKEVKGNHPSGASVPLDVDTIHLRVPGGYTTLLRAIAQRMPSTPSITINYKDVTVQDQVPVHDPGLPNLAKKTFEFVTCGSFNHKGTKAFNRLSQVSGTIRPSSMTLVLSPPGHGKSTLLQALAGQLPITSGDIVYNGQSLTELSSSSKSSSTSGVSINKLAAYCNQVDVHLPLLTVRETFDFALKTFAVDPALLGNAELANAYRHKVDTMIEMLGLRGCQNTIVGNEYMRGVSGGEKRRVTVGEILLGPAKAIFLDEPTSGLDSSTAEDIMKALRQWTISTNGSVVAALLQPTPEVFALFDNLILLRDGACVYNGPRADVIAYLESQGIYCPSDSDYADFITEYLSLPQVVYARQLRNNTQPPSVTDLLPPTPMASPIGATVAATPRTNIETIPSATTAASSLVDEKQHDDQVHTTVKIHHDNNNTSDTSSSPSTTITATSALAPAPVPAPVYQSLAPGELPAPSFVSTSGYVAPAAAAPAPVGSSETNNSLKKSGSDGDIRGALAAAESSGIPLSTAAMERAFRDSQRFPFHRDALVAFTHARSHVDGIILDSPYAKAQYGSEYAHSWMAHTKHCVQRQAKLMARQTDLIIPRFGQAVLIGLILGSLFYQQGEEAFGMRVGLVLLACDYLSFGNAVEVPIMMDARRVAYKQAAYRLFPTASYIFSVGLMHLPFAAIETLIFAPFLYFMTGFTLDAGRFFIFMAILICHNLAISGWFRALALMSANVEVAQVLAIQSTSLFYLFGGFLLTQPQIPGWFIWMFWMSPFAWTVRACSLNEFHAPRYSHPLTSTIAGSNSTTTTTQSAGDTYLGAWDIQKSDDFIWSAGVYLLAFWLFFTAVSALVLHYRRFPLSIGTRRNEENETDALARDAALAGRKELGKGLRSDQATLSFNNIAFAVQVDDKNNSKKKVWRTLLRNVSGYAQPGTLTALMGASGAGKTTLLDVLAGRKTQGRIGGNILVNGYPKDAATFARVAGYVEQTDSHIGSSTVFETLLFSAQMRLPRDTPDHVRVSFVEEVMGILELSDIRNQLIGDVDEVSLSPGQLKRVTIGVELVANPAILFLDEPTTGLDSRGAQTVVRVIRRVAARGRAVVCTIHQPSAELFYMFDRLLLLQAGGFQVYFGPIGHRGRDIVKYFEAIAGAPKRPPRVNVASWMLEVIGAGTGAKKEALAAHAATAAAEAAATTTTELSTVSVVDTNAIATDGVAEGEEKPIHQPTVYATLYDKHQLRANQSNQDNANLVHPEIPRVTESGYALSWFPQLGVLLNRSFTSHWRNNAFNFTRFLVLTILGVLFGLNYVTWHGDGGQQSSVTSRVSSIFATTAFIGVIHSANGLPVIFRIRAVFYRERSSQTYSPGAYCAQLLITELPYIAFANFLFLIPFYFMTQFKSDAGVFFLYAIGVYVCSLACLSMTLFLAAAMPNQMLAEVLQGFYFNLLFLFGGIFIPSGSIPRGWKWVYEINPVRHASEALTMPQYECHDGTACSLVTTVTSAGTSEMYTHEFVRSYYGWKYDTFWEHIGWMILWIGVVNMLAVYYTKYSSHVKR